MRNALLRLGLTAFVLWLGFRSAAFAELAYRETFEAGDGGYTTLSGSSWAWGQPASGPGAAHSGTNVWATDLQGDYHGNEDSFLTSPAIDLSSYTNHLLVLTWWQYLVTEAGYDFGSVEVSPDGGANWLAAYGEVSGHVSSNWTRVKAAVDASFAVSNFRCRFRLRSDGSTNAPGFYVDDIEVRALQVRTNGTEALAIYSHNFETNDGQYVTSGITSWEWGVPAVGPNTAHSGSNVWATSLTAFYGANEDGYLTSPAIDLSAYPGRAFTLSWWEYLITEPEYDFASVEVTRDGGTNWKVVYGEISGLVAADWKNLIVTLDSIYAVPNFQVRFRLRSDDSLNDFGFYLDDVQVAVVLTDLPVLRDVAKGGNKDTLLPFQFLEFSTNFISTDELLIVRIESLPDSAKGKLIFRGSDVVRFQEIAFEDIGNLIYQPQPNFLGMDSFEWNGSDFFFYSPTNARVNLTITAAPIPGPDTAMGLQNTTVCFANAELLANDRDPEGTALSILSVSTNSSQGGRLFLAGGLVQYTPPVASTGTDTFTYVVSDAQGSTATGLVTMTVVLPLVQVVVPLHFVPQTGLFDQTVRVTNPLTNQICGTMNGARISITGLSTNGRVFNATGTNNGVPYLEFTDALAPGQSKDLVVRYDLFNRVNLPVPVLTPLALSPVASTNAVPTAIAIGRYGNLFGGGFFLEFSADSGRQYIVEYSDDLQTWQPLTPNLTANGTSIQWLDNAPPVVVPGHSYGRYYRVVRSPAP
jgi:hypothetical protein